MTDTAISKDYIPMTPAELEQDMTHNPEYYYNVKPLTASSISAYISRGKIPAVQHFIKSNKLQSDRGTKTLYPIEVRLWIVFGRTENAVLEVIRQRDYSAIALEVARSAPSQISAPTPQQPF